MTENAESKSRFDPNATGTGIAIGVALGAAFSHVALGLALGVAFGAAIDVVMHARRKKTVAPVDSPPRRDGGA